MKPEQYEALRRLCAPVTQEGAELICTHAYLSAREFRGPHQIDERYSLKADGDAFAIDLAAVTFESGNVCVSNPERSLLGRVILATCTARPAPPRVFRRTEGHRGRCVLLKGLVRCKIIAPCTYIPRQEK